jgi:RNA-binding protein YlmH
MEEVELKRKRFIELMRKSDGAPYYIFTDFLGLSEQSIFFEVKRDFPHVKYKSFGGVLGAERQILRFGDEEEVGYDLPFPIVTLKIEPKSQKFAEKLTHRDFLGSILGLGLERTKIGDIVIRDNVGYVFVSDDVSEYITESLTKVRRTDVITRIADALPEGELYKTERRKIQAVGERVDAVIAKVFSLSREESHSLFLKRLVFIDGRLMENPSYIPKKNEVISVRGHGRMIYLGYETTSKKGKLNIEVELFV